MEYIISQRDIDWSKDRWFNKGPASLPFYTMYHKYPERKGYIPLWDRNAQKFAWFKIVRQCTDKMAYVVERGKCPTYWKKTLLSNKLKESK